jgi:hypothetical protein
MGQYTQLVSDCTDHILKEIISKKLHATHKDNLGKVVYCPQHTAAKRLKDCKLQKISSTFT